MNKRTSTVFIATLIFALVLSAAPPDKGGPLSATRVEAQQTFFGAQRAPTIETDKADNLLLMMSVATKPASAGTPGSQVFLTKSTDRGRTWDNFPQTRNLTKSRGETFGPSLAVNKTGKTRAYTVYHDNVTGTTQAYLLRSKKGTKFKSPRNITPGGGGAFAPRIALDSTEALNIVWGDTTNTPKQVVFIRSTDQGETFGGTVNVSRSTGEAFEPEIEVSSDDAINVAWEDTRSGVSRIMFARSTDGGQNFSDPVEVSAEGGATEAHIAVDRSDRIHVVWVQEAGDGSQTFYSRSTDSGETFSAPVNVSDQPNAEAQKPFVTTFRDTVYIAYNDNDSRSKQVFLLKSEDGGVSFSGPEQVSQADRAKGRGHSAAMTVDSEGMLHLVWIDSSIVGRDEGVLFYSNTTNGRRFTPQLLVLAVIQQ